MVYRTRRRRRMLLITTLMALALALGGCNIDWADTFGSGSSNSSNYNNNGIYSGFNNNNNGNPPGFASGQNNSGFGTTFNGVSNSINGQATGQTQAVNFNNIAGSGNNNNNGNGTNNGSQITSSQLGQSRVILFGNPSQDIPIIQSDPRAALDLPPRMLVYASRDSNSGNANSNDVGVAYNNADYLNSRYDLSNAGDALGAMNQNLQQLATDASGGDALTQTSGAAGISRGLGIKSATSRNDFATTVRRLQNAIDDQSGLDLLDAIDNRAIANQSGYSLNPNTLLIVVDRRDELPLLETRQTIGIDLPQKILVSQADDATVTVYYNDPQYIAERHGVADHQEQIDALAETLGDLVDQATGG